MEDFHSWSAPGLAFLREISTLLESKGSRKLNEQLSHMYKLQRTQQESHATFLWRRKSFFFSLPLSNIQAQMECFLIHPVNQIIEGRWRVWSHFLHTRLWGDFKVKLPCSCRVQTSPSLKLGHGSISFGIVWKISINAFEVGVGYFHLWFWINWGTLISGPTPRSYTALSPWQSFKRPPLTQGSVQNFIWCPLPASNFMWGIAISLSTKMFFQPQGAVLGINTSQKDVPRKYLSLVHKLQQVCLLLTTFQTFLKRAALAVPWIELIPNPPIAIGWHIESQAIGWM